MASSTTFVLKEPKGESATLIYLVVRFNSYEISETGKKKYRQAKFSTGMKWNPKHWDFKKHKGVNRQGYPDPTELNQSLQNIKTAAADIYRRLVNNGINVTADSLREELHKREDLFPDIRKHEIRSSAKKSVSQNFVGFYSDYIDDVKFIYKKGKPYPVSERTRQKYRTTLRHLKAFIVFKHKTYDFEDIDLEFYHDFVDFLRNNAKKVATKKVPNPEPIKMTENTVGKHITTIKTILNAATDAGVNNNLKYQSQKFAVLTEDVDKIYLTESELKKIYDQDFSKTKSLDRVRDLFLVGCYTCLRFSDFTNINPANIYNNEKGTFIKLSTLKTGELVVIPLHWIVTSILHKYDYNLPKSISNQKMNDYLKEIGSKAGIDDPVSITKFEGGIKIARTYPKYKLISTHTARRSGATNMYLAGIPAISIMKITGHRTEQAFMRYIQMTQEDNANKLMDHPFFANQQNLKVI